MALMETPLCNTGWKAPVFELTGTDGKTYSLEDLRGEKGTLVMFICNHCPYVKGIMDRLPQTMEKLQSMGIAVVAIMSNDAEKYSDDSFENMQKFAAENNFTFPYLIDETQEVARAYDAVCTPDFFGFDASLALQYRGRLDSSGAQPQIAETKPELLMAMEEVANSGNVNMPQIASMGCSIKWK